MRRAVLVAAVLACLASVAVIVVGAVRVHDLNSTPAARNDALVDRGGTQDVARQVEAAMTELWSYDYRSLERSKAQIDELGTAHFRKQYAGVFRSIETLAPQVHAVVDATVTQVAVKSLEGDRATAIVFLSQRATKTTVETPSTAAARLTVTMKRERGAWKVDGVTPF